MINILEECKLTELETLLEMWNEELIFIERESKSINARIIFTEKLIAVAADIKMKRFLNKKFFTLTSYQITLRCQLISIGLLLLELKAKKKTLDN